MRLLFVTQESGESPSGVYTIVKELCKNWTEKDEIFLLTNKYYRSEVRVKSKFTDVEKCTVFYCRIEFHLRFL
jgi:hypothetical protein